MQYRTARRIEPVFDHTRPSVTAAPSCIIASEAKGKESLVLQRRSSSVNFLSTLQDTHARAPQQVQLRQFLDLLSNKPSTTPILDDEQPRSVIVRQGSQLITKN
ncbi:hypothetical protein MRB53_037254 [Persea americana]|nr:hypothetical protein MRB53_037254 [Persea americana]